MLHSDFILQYRKKIIFNIQMMSTLTENPLKGHLNNYVI